VQAAWSCATNNNKNSVDVELSPKKKTQKESTSCENSSRRCFSMSGTKGMTHYPPGVKLEAMQLHEEAGLSFAQIAEQLGIRQAARIKAWYRAYRREGELAFHKPIGRPRKAEPELVSLARLRMENALLKKFRTELRKAMLAKRNIGLSNTTERNTP
jgi:transposase-like protein